MKKYYYSLGFTLVELMVTIAIVAILLTVAAPSMLGLISRNNIDTYQTDLIGDISFARQEAIRRNKPITICSSADGVSCEGVTVWTTGWIVFVDEVGGVAGAVNPNDEILKVRTAVNAGDSIDSTEAFFQFNARGWLVLPAVSVNTDVTLTACAANNTYLQGVLIMASGRALTSRIDAAGNPYVIRIASVPQPLAGCP